MRNPSIDKAIENGYNYKCSEEVTANGTPARSKAGRKAANMTKYDVKVMSLETGMTFTLEGRWESRSAMDEDLKKAGYVVIGCWTAFNQD